MTSGNASAPDSLEPLPEHAQRVIAKVLCGQALADHLGDVRDEERLLWGLLGVPDLHYSHPVHDTDSVFRITKARLIEGGMADYLPDFAQGDDDDDDV